MGAFHFPAMNFGLKSGFNGAMEESNMEQSNDNLAPTYQNALVEKEGGTMDSFARNLVDLRKKAGLTQEELASKLELSAQSISKYETGIANPDISYLPGLADALGVTIDRLFGRESVVYVEERKPKKIIVKVNSKDGDNVNLNLPYRVARSFLKSEGNSALKDIDLEAVFEAAEQGCFGTIIDVKSADGDVVQIIVE